MTIKTLIAIAMAMPLCITEVTAAELWRVDATESRLGFVAIQQQAEFEGEFTEFSALIRFDPDDLDNSRVRVDIPITSFSSGYSERDQMAIGPDFFHAEKWPTARFETISITHKEGDRYEARATLRIRDITRQVTLPFALRISEKSGARRAHMQGALTIRRTVFGVGQGQWRDTTWIGDPVTVKIDLQAVSADP